MAETVKLPGIGPVSKTTALALGAVALAVVGVGLYRSRQASAAAGTGDTTSSQIDPATGYPYGSAEDEAALAQQAASLAGGVGLSDFTGSSGTATTPTATGYATNAQWAQAAEDYLVGTIGSDAHVVGNALGKYITGGILTSDQVSVVTQAIAFAGYPPVNGPTGYPPSYHVAAAPTKLPAPANLRVTKVTKTSVSIAWTAVPGAAGYYVNLASPTQGQHHSATLGKGTLTFTHGGLAHGKTYQFWVQAFDSAGAGAQSHVSAKTS